VRFPTVPRQHARVAAHLALVSLLLIACTTSVTSVSRPPQQFLSVILGTYSADTLQYGFRVVDVTPGEIGAVRPEQQALVWLGGYDNTRCDWVWSDAQVVTSFAQYGLAHSPRTSGYFLADEPNTAGNCPATPAQLRARSRLVRSLDPDLGHFTFADIDDPAQFRAFGDAVDVIGTDPYPCQVGKPCDWSLIPAYIAALRAAGVTRYLAFLQAFGADKWRWPSAGELENMIAQWQRSNWSGEIAFSWTYGGSQLIDHPDLLAVLARLNGTPQAVFPLP
jgi:hypothetical protein